METGRKQKEPERVYFLPGGRSKTHCSQSKSFGYQNILLETCLNEDSRMTDISDNAFLPRGKIQRDELKQSAKALRARQFIYMLKQRQTRDVSG